MRETAVLCWIMFLIVVPSSLIGWFCGYCTGRKVPLPEEQVCSDSCWQDGYSEGRNDCKASQFIPPALEHFVCPPYLGMQPREGKVKMLLSITDAGLVESVNVAESSGHAELDALAVECARTWQFKPATRGGEPIAFNYTFTLSFRILSREPVNQYKVEQEVP